MVPPLLILAAGFSVVLVSILWLRLNPLFGLITAAIVVSVLCGSDSGDQLTRVAAAFGQTAGSIGIAIAMAAVIGACLIASGAATKIVDAILAVFGQKRAAGAMAASGFLLSVPVFFDTVFYLLLPLAQATYARTGKGKLRLLLAIGAGGAVTHTMVPPTPGPLLMADAIGVSVGLLIVVGGLVSIPMTLTGLAFAAWADRRMPLQAETPESEEAQQAAEGGQPGLLLSLLPVLLPILLIAIGPISAPWLASASGESPPAWLLYLTDKNLALLLAAALALGVYARTKRPTREQLAAVVEDALASAGVIVLITSAGGAFGAMLKLARVNEVIDAAFAGEDGLTGLGLLLTAALMAAILKSSQGSTTVALITVSSMMAAAIEGVTLDFHPVYLCAAIGSGAMITSWMNDSGFWIFCRMGGLTAEEGMRTWAPLTALMGVAGLATTLLLASVFPGV